MSFQQEIDKNRAVNELKGNTLRVYSYILKAKYRTVGVREVQRRLGFSSPTLAVYHLDKLRDLGLVVKDSGEYKVLREVKIDALRLFTRIGPVFVPRSSFYAVAITILLSYYISQLGSAELSNVILTGLLLGSLASIFLWIESWKAWRRRL